MRAIVFRVCLLLLLLGPIVSAQFDRAKAEALPDVRKAYDATLSALNDNNRDKAIDALTTLAKAIIFAVETTKDVPGILSDGGLRDEGSKVRTFVDASQNLRDKAAYLAEKVKRVGESYSSELSSFKSADEDFERKYADANAALLTTAGSLKKAMEALKKACPACLNN